MSRESNSAFQKFERCNIPRNLVKILGVEMARKKTDGSAMKSRAEIIAAHERKKAAMNEMFSDEITPDEIVELIGYMGGRHIDLAEPLDVTHATIYNYVKGLSVPPRPTRMIMRRWLDKFRKDARKRAKRVAVKSA